MEQQLLEKRMSDAMRFIRNHKEQLAKLRAKVSQLENILSHCLADDQSMWLFRNRSERMDPTVPIFDAGRAEFHLARYRFACQYVRGLQVADVACGTGYGSEILMKEGAAVAVIGIDISLESINYAMSRHGSSAINYIVGSAEKIPLPDCVVDAVISFETIEHLESDRDAIGEFARILRPDGRLVCSTPNNWPLEIAAFHKKIFDRDSFLDLLSTHFEVLELFNQNSGTDFEYNRGQAAGIVPTTDKNYSLAECYLAVCRVKK